MTTVPPVSPVSPGFGAGPVVGPVVSAGSRDGLTFAELSRANRERCGRWHPGFPSDETWTGADWSNALGGEAGELAEAALAIVAFAGKVQNTTKKIRRYETGTSTEVDKPLDVLFDELDAEMADVACYLDLLATKYGRDLAGAIVAKFNVVSERQGFPERLADVPSLLAEVEAIKRDRARLIAELHGAHREAAAVRGVVQAVAELCEQIETGGHEASKLPDSFVGAAALAIAREIRAALAAAAVPTQDEHDGFVMHALTEYGTTNCPVQGVRASVDDGECSACGAPVAASLPAPTEDGKR